MGANVRERLDDHVSGADCWRRADVRVAGRAVDELAMLAVLDDAEVVDAMPGTDLRGWNL
jgi:hypothetical protein